MQLSRKITRLLVKTQAAILVESGKDENKKPIVVVRTITKSYRENPRKQEEAGVIIDIPLKDGTLKIPYSNILGWNTGYENSVQPLILRYEWGSYLPLRKEWETFLKKKARLLLMTKIPALTEALTTTHYSFTDKWDGRIHRFVKLEDAIESAKKQTGTTVYIYDNKRATVKVVKATGHCPP